MLFLLPVALSALTGGGCATPIPIPGAKPDLLDFLQVKQTAREEVVYTLGQPSGVFEQDTILTYRIGHDKKQGYFIVTPKQLMPWQSVSYSLVLIFDESGILQKYRMVDVQ